MSMNELAEVVHPLLQLIRLVFRKVGTIPFAPPYPHFYDGQHQTLSSCRETSRRRAAPLSSWVHVGLIQNVTAASQKKSTDHLFALPHKPRFVRFEMLPSFIDGAVRSLSHNEACFVSSRARRPGLWRLALLLKAEERITKGILRR
jgi:hypothetical protein